MWILCKEGGGDQLCVCGHMWRAPKNPSPFPDQESLLGRRGERDNVGPKTTAQPFSCLIPQFFLFCIGKKRMYHANAKTVTIHRFLVSSTYDISVPSSLVVESRTKSNNPFSFPLLLFLSLLLCMQHRTLRAKIFFCRAKRKSSLR